MLDTSKIYTSKNYGDFKIIEYINCNKVKIEFIDTCFVAFTQSVRIKNGTVKDRYKPSLYGIGFIGKGKHKARLSGKITKSYQTWAGMLERCYCPKYQERCPTYKGCSVVKEWHNFQNFADWFELNYKKDLQLDKDVKIKGNKVYSPSSCQFVTHAENSIEAHAKHYKLINPQGETVRVYNMSQFARDNNLNESNLLKVTSGKRHQHKGWKKSI